MISAPETELRAATLCPAALANLADSLARFCSGNAPEAVLPWVEHLSARERDRLREELTLVLSEPEITGEPLDWAEVVDILREYAGQARWDGALLQPQSPSTAARYAVEVRPRDLRTLERSSSAVQDAARELLARFLPLHPTAADRLERGSLKKLSDREIWQISLPDGYRLRYYLAELERTVHVVYLGPHPDGDADGREQAVRATVRRRRHGG